MDYTRHVQKNSPQRERTLGRNDEVKNSEGGYVHAVNDWQRLDRFLILGSEGGTYYINERDLTKQNAESVLRLIQSDNGKAVVDRVVAVSSAGRAHKNDAALFVLAMAAKLGNTETRQYAFAAMSKVVRIGTHLFTFAQFIDGLGGWSKLTMRAFQRWYNEQEPDRLARNLLKYRSRGGWSHRDILRKTHPVTTSDAHRAMFDVTAHPEKLKTDPSVRAALPKLYTGYAAANFPVTGESTWQPKAMARVIEDYDLSWEMLPTEWLKIEAVNQKLLEKMPLMATIRQLGKMAANGTLKPMSDQTQMMIDRLTNQDVITRSRIHPLHYLLALKNYSAGHGWRSSASWAADGRIIDALNEGFYKAFVNVDPTGKAFLLGIDVSSSMRTPISDTNLSCAEAAAAMAMVIARTEPKHFMHGFCGGYGYRRQDQDIKGFVNLGISSKDSLDSVCQKVQNRNFGSTDCAIPMLYALNSGVYVDTFVVLTDSETWAGNVKPVDALRKYREKVNPNARLVVVGMTSNGFTIADPTDSGMLDVVGFDASVMPVISEFSR